MRKDKSDAAKVDRRSFKKQPGGVIGTAGTAAAAGSTEDLAKTVEPQGQAAGDRESGRVRA
jgi:hypothetical protein